MEELWRRQLQTGSGRGSQWNTRWVFKPMMLGMQVCGLTFTSHVQSGISGLSVSLVYFTGVFVLLWANFLRYFVTYNYNEVLGPNFLQKVFVHFVHGLGAMSIIAYIPLARKCQDLTADFESYCDKYQCWSKPRQIKRRKLQVIVLVVCAVSICLQMFIIVLKIHFLIPCSLMIDMHFKGILDMNDSIPVMWEVILLVIVFYNAAAVVFAVGYILLVALMLAEEFRSHASDMQTLVKNSAGLSHNLEYLRLRFRDLSKLTRCADKVFSVFTLIIYVSDILICCFVIYISIHVRMEQDFLIQMTSTFIPSFLAFLFQLVILTYGGTVLNHAVSILRFNRLAFDLQANSSKEILYYADLSRQDWNVGYALQYSTFLAELREDRIGLSAWNLFYINQATVKTVVLMIVTYSVILLKFGNNEDAPIYAHHVTQSANLTSSI
ncbi:hypothetical protein CAPTEDRAFT_203999 [Capitella teleta]|uniref:Gustatory receptor n=1 Tax=Capitella teleta TaxID=283909 RepID=R7UUM2_CAPTE|nr:hypothetical protein CAPTEDRAFT_203999 [Capitella teleta]|eukprot:ELU10343.1 hypothetical protein CAPTEDRAFT_203999 [Capitella teleta]